MGRISSSEKAKYVPLTNHGKCYYCDEPTKLTDTTPNHRVHPDIRKGFPEQWSITDVCASCWSKIHRVNWIESGVKFGVRQGMMTLSQKEALCKIGALKGQVIMPFGLGFNGTMVVPTGLMQDSDDDTKFYLKGIQWSILELRALQGPMALRGMGAPSEVVAECFWALVSADSIENTLFDIPKYQRLLEIENVSSE